MKIKQYRFLPFIIMMSLLICNGIFAQEVSTFAFKINGHMHSMEEDLVNRALQEWYDETLESNDLYSLVDSLALANNLTITEFNMPEDVRLVYEMDETGQSDFMGTLILDPWTILANGYGCDFNGTISHVGLQFAGNSEFENATFQIELDEPLVLEPDVIVDGNGGAQCPLLADALANVMKDAINQYLADLAATFDSVATEELFVLINPIESLGINDPELVDAALQSFPLDMALYTEKNDALGTIQLVNEVNFLMGTTVDPVAFIGIEPDKVSGSNLEMGGFGFLYWGLQRGFTWHTDWDESQRVDASFHIMDNMNLNGYRIEARWSNIHIRAYLGETLNPDDIRADIIDNIIADTDHWNLNEFEKIRDILDNGASRGLVPFMALGVGHQDRIPFNESGQRIAPATDLWQAPDGYAGVSADEYLFNLKIYAYATVQRFADYVDVWQIENELNAAGWAAAIPDWWRDGDLWQDEDFRQQVWDILVEAVRSQDPTALITHDLHMLGFMQALENWVEDLDIVGFNYYPNLATALPVLGFSVGEYVWAIRRALKGLGFPNKPVWLIESGYPALEINDPPDSLVLADDSKYFSESRQKEYIETALTSAVENGINGFFLF